MGMSSQGSSFFYLFFSSQFGEYVVILVSMFNKIFFGLFISAVLVMGIMAVLAYFQLASIGFGPAQIVENFLAYDRIYKTVLWISSLILLVMANVILWTTRKAWALWLTFAYFAVFIMLNMWWLGEVLADFNTRNNLTDGGFQLGGLVGAILVIVIGAGVFFNQFLVLRMQERLYPQPTETSATETESSAERLNAQETDRIAAAEELPTKQSAKDDLS
jgi:hypothetical protein